MKTHFHRYLFIAILTLSTSVLRATEKDLYDFMWLDPDKKVYVLQNKVHKKDGTFYINAGYGLGLSSTFQDTSLLHFNSGYYLNEEWALEGIYTSYSNKDNEAFENLKRLNGSIPFIRRTLSNYGLLVKWSPFYGKVNTFNKIFYFDWSFGAGLGKLNTESNAKTVANSNIANSYSSESYSSVILKTGISVHATKNIHIGLDLIMNNYSAPGPTINNITPSSKMRNNMDTLLTIGYSF